MVLKLFDTMTKKKKIFKPLKDKEVKMFVCGQTVYDDAHLGHAKTYVNFDILARFLRYLGYKLHYIQNITDIDDKIINRAKEKGEHPLKLAEHFTKRFFEDIERLKIKETINDFPKSTDYIPQMIDQINTLLKKGYAYVVDGDVYFDVSKFKDYTKLSRMKLKDLEKHRIEPDERKRNSYDFSLWKSAKLDEISWDSPFGKGRPGWHIEDTAITVTIFGPQYDIHGGANELIFPHHTNEIAQAEAATGIKPFVKYWLHSGVLNIRGQKMSKSLKNFITIREALEKYSPETLRLWIASTHYRKPIDYNEKDLEVAKKKIEKIKLTLERINENYSKAGKGEFFVNKIKKLRKEFLDAMNDDINTPLALTKYFELITLINKQIDKNQFSKNDLKLAEETMKEFGNLFQIIPELEKKELPKEVLELIKKRETMRKIGDFETADKIRNEIKERFGIILEDTKEGVKWKFVE
ncbi:MAG: cysteine--tRNA ligase [Candidatus Aenigmatarchaeota archaeon]|nr:cysteine--tRNA ligase [Candidatus Aenigmarchaeota archaeon]